jgi:FtsH-binding integral membrane protein
VLTVLLVGLAIATGFLLLVRTNRHATAAENRITVIIAVVFVVLLAVDRVW